MPRNDGRWVAHAGNHLIPFGVYIDLRLSVRSDRDAEKREAAVWGSRDCWKGREIVKVDLDKVRMLRLCPTERLLRK